jgi:hypothetical protein
MERGSIIATAEEVETRSSGEQPKFTRGPWMYARHTDCLANIYAVGGRGSVADVSRWQGGIAGDAEENFANACLITAAPALCGALRDLYLDYEDDCGCKCENENCRVVVGQRCVKCHARAALALVDGPQETK